MNRADEYKLQRRVAGYHDIRLDGMTDLVLRAKGASVLDLGCNRGLIGFEMANNSATLVHGCDIDADCIKAAENTFAKLNENRDMQAAEIAAYDPFFDRSRFIDLRAVESRFEVVDLTTEIPFPKQRYDIVLMIATYHKLKRVMTADALSALMRNLAGRTDKFFGWRGNGNNEEATDEMINLDRDLGTAGLKRVQTSQLSLTLGLAAIWAKT